VQNKHRELVVALLVAGADANVKNTYGATSVFLGAYNSTADILQLLVDGGGSVNEPESKSETPLIRLVRSIVGDAAARLDVLLSRPELDLDATWETMTAEKWAVSRGRPELAAAIAAEVGSLAPYFLLSHGHGVLSLGGRPLVAAVVPRLSLVLRRCPLAPLSCYEPTWSRRVHRGGTVAFYLCRRVSLLATVVLLRSALSFPLLLPAGVVGTAFPTTDAVSYFPLLLC
jgi:hypothetical protein